MATCSSSCVTVGDLVNENDDSRFPLNAVPPQIQRVKAHFKVLLPLTITLNRALKPGGSLLFRGKIEIIQKHGQGMSRRRMAADMMAITPQSSDFSRGG